MKTFLIGAFLLIAAQSAIAQPLSGSFTVGGASPDFAALQDAANALKRRGVSGPTFFNIRPGIYTRSNSTVLLLDSLVAGLSETNRITFQPDQASGGNVGNVILEMDRTNAFTADLNLVVVKLDFVTFRNLTFQHVDSLFKFSNGLVRLEQGVGQHNLIVDDFVLTGCRFFGGPNRGPNVGQGTDYGISGSQLVSKATITNNRFTGIRWAVSIENGAGPRAGTVVVEDNEVYAGFGGGTAILVAAANATVRRNRVDFTGGIEIRAGIQVLFASVGLVERNIVMNARGGNFTGIIIAGIEPQIIADSVLVANNIITGNIGGFTTGIEVTSRNTKVVHNTILNPGPSGITNLFLDAVNCTVVNNIFINGPTDNFSLIFHHSRGQTPGLISDHNIIFFTNRRGQVAFIRDGTSYQTFVEYQTATGLDTNSVFKEIEFVVDSLGLHLDGCQAQDLDLYKGIPIPQVSVDFFGAPRDNVTPTIGAIEGTPAPFDMFAAPFKAGLPGTPFSIAAGRFDNLLLDGLAIPDYDNKQILLYHNIASERRFEPAGSLLTFDCTPSVVKFYDLDEDANLDLIVGCDENLVGVFWGDGLGGFPLGQFVETLGRVRSLEPGPSFDSEIRRTVVMTEDNGFVPTASWLGYLAHEGDRVLCTDVQRRGIFVPDTIHSTLVDLVVKNLGGDGTPEVAAVTLSPLPPRLVLINNMTFPLAIGLPCPLEFTGTVNELQFGTGNLTASSSIIAEDFDGDSDLDLLTTGASENECILIRNQGNFNFTAEPIPTRNTRAIAALDYENDGDLDFVAANRPLDTKGITVFLNDGSGQFTEKTNCFLPFASGEPSAIIASDFDLDGMTDVAVTTFDDSLFVLYNLGGGLTAVEEHKSSELPGGFSLSQNYPNPFNPSTLIKYMLPAQSHVTLKIYNILGREVRTLVDGEQPPGVQTVRFDAAGLASGVYFYRLSTKRFSLVKKMLILK